MKEKISQLEKLVARATNPRQRTMYQKLLEKAQKQLEVEKATTATLEVAPSQTVVATLETTNSTSENLLQGEEKQDKQFKEANKSKKKRLKETNSPSSKNNSSMPPKKEKQSQFSARISQKKETTTEKKDSSKIAIFQAIGVIEGIIAKDENGKVSITIEGQKYPLGYAVQSKRKNYQDLVRELAEKKSIKRKISVYPHYNHQEERSHLSFNLVSVEKEKKGAIFSDLEAGEFRVAGFWQYIPYCEIPCITVLRNYQEQLAKTIEKMGQKKAKGLLKANHLPILWSNASHKAFQYNEDLPKKEQMPRYFVQLKVKWKAESGLFEVIEEIEKASTTAPKYLRYKS